MVHDRLLDEAHLDRLKTLILPNIAALSDAQCRQLRAFVERGGGLVATYETSLRDERGERRAGFGLGGPFGGSLPPRAPGPVREAHLPRPAGPPLLPPPRRRADAERLPAARGRPPPRPQAPAPGRPGRRAPGHPRDLAARCHAQDRVYPPTADAHPELPRPADGDGLSSRPEDRRR